jgi:hypothetical protein
LCLQELGNQIWSAHSQIPGNSEFFCEFVETLGLSRVQFCNCVSRKGRIWFSLALIVASILLILIATFGALLLMLI